MLESLDGPAVQDKVIVTTVEVEAKVGLTAFLDRKVVTIQPLTGKVLVTFEAGKDGLEIFNKQMMTFEASDTQPLYIKAFSGSVDVIVAERA
jgi:hypothetical protein